MKYDVIFTFGGCITVEADSVEMAEAVVAEKDDDVLMDYALDGFEIQSVKEVI